MVPLLRRTMETFFGGNVPSSFSFFRNENEGIERAQVGLNSAERKIVYANVPAWNFFPTWYPCVSIFARARKCRVFGFEHCLKIFETSRNSRLRCTSSVHTLYARFRRYVPLLYLSEIIANPLFARSAWKWKKFERRGSFAGNVYQNCNVKCFVRRVKRDRKKTKYPAEYREHEPEREKKNGGTRAKLWHNSGYGAISNTQQL